MAQLRLAERVIREAYLARENSKVAAQKLTQHSSRDNKTLPVTFKSKACAPLTFVRGERRGDAVQRLGRNVQTDGPAVDFHHPANPTTASRGASDGFLPCA